MNVITPINNLGFGLVGLNLVKSLWEIGADPALFPLGGIEAGEEYHAILNRALSKATQFNPSLPCLKIWHSWDMALQVGRGPHFGFPFFEMDELRSIEKHHLGQLDGVFVASEWARSVLIENGLSPERTHTVPLGVDTSIFRPCEPIQGGPTVFFNCGKWELRKGHDILRDAFCAAFSKTDNVRLVMNCSNPFLSPADQAEWVSFYKNSPMGDKTEVIAERLPTQRDVAQLMARVDVGVFPSRAEGWNMELAEMMAMGKQVIATNYTAHTQFADSKNCYLIDVYETEEADDGIWFGRNPNQQQGNWAKLGRSQFESLVYNMRYLHRLKQEGQLGVNTAGIETFKIYTWENAARKIKEVVDNSAKDQLKWLS